MSGIFSFTFIAKLRLGDPRLDSGEKEEFPILEAKVTRHLERMGFR